MGSFVPRGLWIMQEYVEPLYRKVWYNIPRCKNTEKGSRHYTAIKGGVHSKMKRVLINRLKGGETLAQAIWDDNGALWLAEGTVYKNSYLDKLDNLGIDYLYIKEDFKNSKLTPKKEFYPDLLRQENKMLVRRQLRRFEKHGSISAYKFELFIFKIMDQVLDNKEIIDTMYSMKKYNHYTYEHSVNVTIISIMISKQMGLSSYEIYEVAMGCILHDLGKMQISENILNKPALLTAGEFNEIKKHPISGYQIVKESKHITKDIQEIILTHHEKLDGSGYPLGISGDEISTGTRICTIADIFDAMCSKRPYKEAVPFAESLRTMKTSMNKQLDMAICGQLEEILE